MSMFFEIDTNIALEASRRILKIKAQNLITRFVDEFEVDLEYHYLFKLLMLVDDTPKFRHWLSVSRSLLRSKSLGCDIEPQFISHFYLDSLNPQRLAELHIIGAIELLIDDAVKKQQSLAFDFPNIKTARAFHTWHTGTIFSQNFENGLALNLSKGADLDLQLGSRKYQLNVYEELLLGGVIQPDMRISVNGADILVASNVPSLANVYLSNLPIVKGKTALADWAKYISCGMNLLDKIDANLLRDCALLAKAVCPLHCNGVSFGSSSPTEVIGLVFLPAVRDYFDVAECLVHESMHQKLYHCEEGARLLDGDAADDEIYYSPWRPDPRPLRMLIHGAFVFTAVAEFWSMLDANDLCEGEKKRSLFNQHYRLIQARTALDIIEKHSKLTSFGEKIMHAMRLNHQKCLGGVQLDNSIMNQASEQAGQHFARYSDYVR